MGKTVKFKRDYISPSSLNSMSMCGEAFYLHYFCGRESLPDLGKLVGSTSHSTSEAALYYFIDSNGTYPEPDKIKMLAISELNSHIRQQGIRFSREEIRAGEKQTIARAELLVGQMAIFWLENVLPALNPIDKDHIEKGFMISIPGCRLKLKGKIDAVEGEVIDLEENGNFLINKGIIRDLKTGGTNDISQSDQFVAYSWWFYTKHGYMPEVIEDQIKKPNKNTIKITQKSFKYNPVRHTFKTSDFEVLKRKLLLFEKYIEQEIFLPATSMGWWCGEKCGFYDDCRYKYNPKQFSVTK